MANNNFPPVLISGAGIAGLTTALALAQNGIQSTILEKSQSLDPVGAGIQISPNAWRVLSHLGLSEQLEQHTSFPDTIRLYDGRSGNPVCSLPLGQRIKDQYGAPYGVIHRGDLQDVLLEHCQSNPLIKLEFGSEVVDAKTSSAGIQITLGNASNIDGSVLIAADGIWSRIRTHTLRLPAPVNSNKVAWRALIAAGQLPNRSLLGDTHVWLAPHCHVVTYPVSGGKSLNLIFIAPEERSGLEVLPSASSDNLAPVPAQLLQLEARWSAWPLYETPMPHVFESGRIALVGDAAHAMLPFAAQGAAMAIEDAATLAECLHEDDTIDGSLKRFAGLRADRVCRMAKFARANGRIYHLPAPLGFFRNLAMRLIPNDRLMARQDWIYGWRE